jgi:enoyl-CoA hydratase/carnithine racemase
MIRHLTQILSTWRTDPDVHGVILLSSQPDAFCAGGDIRFFYEVGCGGLAEGSTSLEDFFTEEYALNHLIHHYPKPYIAILDGIVMGGGMGIAQSSAASRIRIVTERTRMAMPEVNIGLFPDVGGGYFLSRLLHQIGTYLGLTGDVIGPADALFADLADVFIPSAELPGLYALLENAADDDYDSLVTGFAAPFKAQIDIAGCSFARHHTLIEQHFSGNSVWDITNSLAQDMHPFAQRAARKIKSNSPLLLQVTLEQLRRARTMTLADCLRMERTMMHHCFEHQDAMEGIRAAVIDKDKNPQWQPALLEDVSAEMVARFFAPVWPDDAHPLRELG